MKPSYEELARQQRRLHRLNHLAAMARWDQATMMPPKGNDARAGAMAELETVMHGVRADTRTRELIEAAESEPLDEVERTNLREIRREWVRAKAVPESLIEKQMLANARCEHAWRKQRFANDWKGFLANLGPVISIAREEAAYLAAATGTSKYEALMDAYEPGMTSAELDRIFGELKQWLPALVKRIQQKQAAEAVIAPKGPFPVEKQRALSLKVMALLGFDFEGGRLDESMHPFCGGVPEDVRITTRYNEDDFTRCLMGTIHETGHARYNQNLPGAWREQPIGRPRSAGIHESQSLFFEMQLARSRPFMELLAPLMREAFGDQPAFEPDNLYKLFTRVKTTNLIRVAADEATYPLHVILRYEIERPLIEGEIECEDIPALWDEKMQRYLGLDTRGNYKDGCMQDVHWSEGLVGYFPSYTLGAMYAAQWFAAIRRTTASVDAASASAWLQANVWSQGRRWETAELLRRGTSEALNPAHFRRHLEARYL